jgi:large subunit ribosomal protein L6
MSRIGKAPINIPEGVKVEVNDKNVITVKGPKGELKENINPDIKIEVKDSVITLIRPTEQKRHKAMHGLYRAIIANMCQGVSEGYKLQQELVGVGFKTVNKGQVLEVSVGYSHEVYFRIPDEVKVTTETKKGANPTIFLESADKQLIGQVAAKIRAIRKPEPYKGKGIIFSGERVRRKAGKTAGK